MVGPRTGTAVDGTIGMAVGGTTTTGSQRGSTNVACKAHLCGAHTRRAVAVRGLRPTGVRRRHRNGGIWAHRPLLTQAGLRTLTLDGSTPATEREGRVAAFRAGTAQAPAHRARPRREGLDHGIGKRDVDLGEDAVEARADQSGVDGAVHVFHAGVGVQKGMRGAGPAGVEQRWRGFALGDRSFRWH